MINRKQIQTIESNNPIDLKKNLHATHHILQNIENNGPFLSFPFVPKILTNYEAIYTFNS